MIGDTTRTPAAACPLCSAPLNAATSSGSLGDTEVNAKPRPDDATVCVYCGGWLIFKDDMSLRPMTDEELEEVRRQAPALYAFSRARAHLRKN